MDRVILHSDLNCFYAAVETVLNPRLRGQAMVVCGSTEERHGIVLAKTQLAKEAGIKTGMANWQAKKLCPNLILVAPHYEQYAKYSKLVRSIYKRFTDQVEPFGLDECWLDVGSSARLFGSGEQIAQTIRRTVREELGLTVSIGVSFNKIFAKLGSDLKKPDAVTVLERKNFRQTVWPLPVSRLLFCGPATTRRLTHCGILTIGDLAAASPNLLRKLLGKQGEMLGIFANGEDHSPVAHQDSRPPVKSVGHGVTCVKDLTNQEEVWKVILYLAQELGRRLRLHELCAQGVQLSIRSSDLICRQYQKPLDFATQSPLELAYGARELMHDHYDWKSPVRAVSVRAINLLPVCIPRQLSLFGNTEQLEKQQRLDDTIEELRDRFGRQSIQPALLLDNLKLPSVRHESILPGCHTP